MSAKLHAFTLTIHKQTLKRILNKFTKQELLHVVGKSIWFKGYFRSNVPKKTEKCTIVEYLIRNIDEENLRTVISSVSMLYLNMHQKSKTWHVFRICNEIDILAHVNDPVTFERQLKKYMNRSHFNCHVTCEIYEEALWAHLTFSTLATMNGKQKENSTFLIYYPLSPYIMYSDMRVVHRAAIRRALLQIFDGTRIEDIALSARDYRTLIQMVWQKDGSIFNQQASAPSFIPFVVSEEIDSQKPPAVIEHISEEEKCKENYITETYGRFKQPSLETLELMTDTNFYGFEKEVRHRMKCRILFKGPSILEGVRKLLEIGIAAAPLPEFIGNVGKLGQNKFHITEKSDNNYFSDDEPDFFSLQTQQL